jgi:hypothetical protein
MAANSATPAEAVMTPEQGAIVPSVSCSHLISPGRLDDTRLLHQQVTIWEPSYMSGEYLLTCALRFRQPTYPETSFSCRISL